MAEKIKSPVVIFVVLILVSLALAGIGFSLLQKEKAKSSSLQQQVDDLMLKQRIAETKLEEYKKTISQLEVKLKTSQTTIETLTAALDKETAEKQRVMEEVTQLKTDLENQKSLRSDLETKLSKTQKSVEETRAQLKDLEDKKTQLEAKIKELETQAQQAKAQGVELGTIVVGPEGAASGQQAATEPSPKEGKVLVVNKEYNFVVINLGNKDGVKVDDVFSIYHSNNYIGDVKVGKIHDSMSAADFLSNSTKDQVSEGDRVVQKTK
jgi:myosin heavy subunit